jgi:hypothetical protein
MKTALDRLNEARDAVNAWYKDHPGVEPPAEMIDALDRAHDAYRADCERRLREKARQLWESR